MRKTSTVKFLSRPIKTLKRDLDNRVLGVREFLEGALREISEIIASDSCIDESQKFQQYDFRFSEILLFIRHSFPRFPLKPYEEKYDTMIKDEYEKSVPNSGDYLETGIYKFRNLANGAI